MVHGDMDFADLVMVPPRPPFAHSTTLYIRNYYKRTSFYIYFISEGFWGFIFINESKERVMGVFDGHGLNGHLVSRFGCSVGRTYCLRN